MWTREITISSFVILHVFKISVYFSLVEFIIIIVVAIKIQFNLTKTWFIKINGWENATVNHYANQKDTDWLIVVLRHVSNISAIFMTRPFTNQVKGKVERVCLWKFWLLQGRTGVMFIGSTMTTHDKFVLINGCCKLSLRESGILWKWDTQPAEQLGYISIHQRHRR